MSKDDPNRSEKIDLIARNTCDLKKRTVQCCGPEETPKEVIQHNFIQDFLTSPSSTIKSKEFRFALLVSNFPRSMWECSVHSCSCPCLLAQYLNFQIFRLSNLTSYCLVKPLHLLKISLLALTS